MSEKKTTKKKTVKKVEAPKASSTGVCTWYDISKGTEKFLEIAGLASGAAKGVFPNAVREDAFKVVVTIEKA